VKRHGVHSEPLDPNAYRALVEGVPAILYIDEPDELSTNRYTSPQLVEILGFTLEEWTSDPDLWVRRIHPGDRERVTEENRISNETGGRFFSEYRLLARDGREVWFRDEAVLVRDADGSPMYWRGVMLDITEQKRADEKLRVSLEVLRRTIEQRRVLARLLESAQQEERRRIAADIHDDPIQVMNAVDLRLQMLEDLATGSIDPQELAELRVTVRLSIERLRHLLFELWPRALDTEGLVAALKLSLEDAGRETGWRTVVVDDLGEEPPEDTRVTLYRLANEAIANARKHAGATRVEVAVSRGAGGVVVRVRDDGKGFDPTVAERPQPGHMGLATIAERAELLGGWCRVTSDPGKGTTVQCWLPTHEDAVVEISSVEPPQERTLLAQRDASPMPSGTA
jgi:PAS domain S-box-containing protein